MLTHRLIARRVLKLISSCLALLTVPLAFAANLIPDPDFNAGNVSSWPAPGSGSTISFDGTQSIVGTVGSGSALVANTVANLNANSTICLPGSYAAGVYQFGGWIRIASPANGTAVIGLVFYTTSDCSSGSIVGAISGSPSSSDTWTLETTTLTLTSAASSAAVYLNNRPNATPPLSVNYDGIRFGPSGTTPVTLKSFDVD